MTNGHLFEDFDLADSIPVVLISEAFARRHFSDEAAIGKKITARFGGPVPREIVGIVGEVRHSSLDSAPRPEVFIPHSQNASGSMTLVARAEVDPLAQIQAIRGQVWAIDRFQTIYEAATLDDLISRTIAGRRFSVLSLGLFATLAVILAAIGIYGVVSFSVGQRNHEIGVRVTLGAERRNIVSMVLRESLVLISSGIAIGLTGAFVLTRYLESLLYGIRPTDAVTFAGASFVVFAVAILACYVPARRATHVDPLIALRYE